MASTSTRKSTRSKKRKNDDEGSDEAILKKFKQLEDRFSKSEDSNKALMAEVKSLRQKQGSARNHASNDEDSHSDSNEADSDSDIAHRSDDPSTLFSSRKISVKSRGDPDKPKGKHHLPANDQGLPLQHQGPSLTRNSPAPGHVNTPAGDSESGPAMPHKPNAVPPPAATPPLSAPLPAHPWPPALLAPGVDPKAPKTANKVYDTVVAGMLTGAQHRFETLLFTENAYPDLDTQIRWSIECWETVCAESQRYFELSKEMRNSIKGRCSHGRGAVLTRVRPVVEALFDMNTAKLSVVRQELQLN